VKMKGDIVAGKKKSQLPLDYASEVEFVDEFTALDQPAAGDFDARRTYVGWREGADEDVPEDNELSGARVLVTRRAGTIAVELEGRIARKKELERVLDQVEGIAWIELPVAAVAGEAFALEPAALVRVLLDLEGELKSAQGRFTLASVDGQGLATLTGTLLAAAQPEEPANAQATFEGECTLLVDTRARRLQGASWKGQATLFMEDEEASLSGKGTFESRLQLAAGAAAREALARKVVYRDVPRQLDQAEVGLELPSHWFERDLGEEGGTGELFSTAVHGDTQLVSLEFRVFALEGAAADATIDAALAAIGEENALFDEKGVSCPLGKGRSARYRFTDEALGEVESLIELYPCGRDRLLRVQLYGSREAFSAELRAWSKTQKTLKLRR